MIALRYTLTFAALALFAAGCGPSSDHDHDHDHPDGKGHDHDHKGGKKEPDGHGHNGPKHALGSAQIGGIGVEATQVGAVAAGHEGVFELKVNAGASELKALRAWVGVESAEGSVKAKAEVGKDGDCDLHLELPKVLPAGAALWVEVESATGTHRHHFATR